MLIRAGALADEPRVSALLSSGAIARCAASSRRVDFSNRPAPPRDIEGISIRGFRPEEARQLYEAHVEAFARSTGVKAKKRTRNFRHHHMDGPRYDADLWFVAWDGEELAEHIGAHDKSLEDPSRGYIAVLGVRSPYRGRGIGEASPPRLRGAICTRPARSRPARRCRFAYARDAAVRPSGHDGPPPLRELGEGGPQAGPLGVTVLTVPGGMSRAFCQTRPAFERPSRAAADARLPLRSYIRPRQLQRRTSPGLVFPRPD